jgi:hypothetical protein
MTIEGNAKPLEGEHPAYSGMRFVCDYCGEAMLSSQGVGVELPVEHGGEAIEGVFIFTLEGEVPAAQSYHVHKVECEWHFVRERNWPHEHYYSYDLAPVE